MSIRHLRQDTTHPDERDRDRGAALVEFALILPLLLMLLVGIVEFGMAYSADVSIHGAAREGARCLALGQVDCSVSTAVDGAKGSAQNVTYQIVASCPADASPSSTAYATVTVHATYTFSIPFVDLGTKGMSATASMRCGL